MVPSDICPVAHSSWMLRHNAYLIPLTPSPHGGILSSHSFTRRVSTVHCEGDHSHITFIRAYCLAILLYYCYCESLSVPTLKIKLYIGMHV